MNAYKTARSGVWWRLLPVGLALLIGVLGLAGAVMGQESGLVAKAPPPNDLPANASVINFPYDASTTDLDEAAVNSEVAHGCLLTTGYSVWFQFTVAVPGKVSLDTRQSDYVSDDNAISIYSPAPVIANEVACNDDYMGDGLAAIFDFPVTAGTYYVQISNWDSDPDEIDPTDFLQLQATFTIDPTPTPTPTATATFTPSDTPTNTATPTLNAPEETATAGGATLTPTNTTVPSTPVSTATATTPPLATELLVNGGIETDIDSDTIPDNWLTKNLLKDKVKCNGDKIVANSGLCAFRFKGGVGEKSKIYQDVNLVNFPLVNGNTLNLSVYTQAKNAATNAKIKVQASYTDTVEKTTISPAFPVSVLYQQTTGSITLISSNLVRVRVQIINKSTAGKVYVDDVSLTLP
ncbi:MAG: hypothetical protein H7X77_11155 [Anaerolineae bacterium]|nr:hypothetical protein [Anaerolineae bacterium]